MSVRWRDHSVMSDFCIHDSNIYRVTAASDALSVCLSSWRATDACILAAVGLINTDFHSTHDLWPHVTTLSGRDLLLLACIDVILPKNASTVFIKPHEWHTFTQTYIHIQFRANLHDRARSQVVYIVFSVYIYIYIYIYTVYITGFWGNGGDGRGTTVGRGRPESMWAVWTAHHIVFLTLINAVDSHTQTPCKRAPRFKF